MIRVLSGLQGFERSRVFVLPLEPPDQSSDGIVFCRRNALHAESLIGIFALGVCHPFPVLFRGLDPVSHPAD